MALRDKTLRGVLWVALQSVGQRGISFIVFLVLARLLEPDAFGVVALAMIFIAFTKLFVNIGFSEAIIQRKELEDQHLDTAFWIIFSIGVVSAAASIFAADKIAELFNENRLAPILRWLSIAIVFTSLNRVQQAILRRQMKFKGLAIRSLIASLAGGVVGVSMAIMGYGVWSLVGQNLASGLAGVLVLWSVSTWRPAFRVSMRHGRDLFSFGVSLMGSNFLLFIGNQIDRILIGYFMDSTALGYYTVAMRLIKTIHDLLSMTLSTVLYSTFSRIQDDFAQLRRVFLSATQLTALLAFPVFTLFVVAGTEIVVVIFGEQWLPSSGVLRIVAVGSMLGAITTFCAPVFKARGKPGLVFKSTLIQSVLGLILFSVSVHWGLIAIAIARAARRGLMAPVMIGWVCKLIKLDALRFVKQFWSPLVGSIGLAASVYAVQALLEPMKIRYLLPVEISVAVVVYFAIVYWMDADLLHRLLKFGRLAMTGKNASKRKNDQV